MLIYIAIVGIIFGGELWIKNYVEKNWEHGKKTPIVHGLLVLRKYHNKGAFLNLGAAKQKLVAILSIILTIVMMFIFVLTFFQKGAAVMKTGLAFLLGGAFSNTYDRLKRKYVVDYVSLGIGNKGIRNTIFNISDVCILFGAMCIVLGSCK